ncbi:hypothetical protein B0H13DRAFT_2398923, partial [Mycena leptocephala]
NGTVLRCVAAELKARKAPTFFKEAKPGTPERADCKKAARLAKRAARAPTIEAWDMTLPPGTALPGLSLIDNHQKLFYRTPRASTDKKLKVIRDGAHESFGRHVSDADIWNSIRTNDFLPRPAQFLWKSIHNAHKIGSYWTHIPGCEERAVCKDCDVLEDLEHILVGCESPGQELIWEAAKTLWLEKETTWPEVSLGTILGCGLADFRDDSGKIDRGAQRLYRILMSESAYQIWRLR